MAKEKEIYRIGEYARYMGVTHDFLKHYEQYGLIHPSVSESGYRHYPFGESYKLLECIKLKHLGFTLRDMDGMLGRMDEREALDALERRMDEMEREIARKRAILEASRAFTDSMRRLGEKQADWVIAERPAMLFLPHTRGRVFIEDERIYDILSDWVRWLPVVKSTQCLDASVLFGGKEKDWRRASCWGLSVEEETARAHGIPVSDVVQRVPGGKYLVYTYRGMGKEGNGTIGSFAGAAEVIRRLGLTPGERILRRAQMSTRVNDAPTHCGQVLAPIAGGP